MSYSKQEFQDLVKEKARERARERKTDLRLVAQAAPAMEHLTGDKHWDLFVKAIQAKVDEANAALEGTKHAWIHSPASNHAQLMEEKMTARCLQARIQALHEVLELPNNVISQGKQAKELLADSEAEAG